MKKLIALFALVVSIAHAELPSKFNVYQTGFGTVDSVCRVLFAEYDKAFNSKTVMSITPGASGMMATLAMLKDKSFAVQCGGSLSESVINTYQYPGHEEELSQQTVVSIIAKGVTEFSTRANSPYSTLPELLKSKKELIIGYNANTPKLTAEIIVSDHSVTWVAYKNSSEAISQLLDGSLDLYVDGGGLIPLIEQGKLKSLGKLNGASNAPGIDLKKLYPEAGKITILLNVITSKANNIDDINELHKRLDKLMNNQNVIDIIKTVRYEPNISTVVEANDYIDNFRKYYVKKYVK